jgi:hypothetical protein
MEVKVILVHQPLITKHVDIINIVTIRVAKGVHTSSGANNKDVKEGS